VANARYRVFGEPAKETFRNGRKKLIAATDAKLTRSGSSVATWEFDAYQDVSTALHMKLKIAIPQISYAKS
jgi:hypothetical protein